MMIVTFFSMASRLRKIENILMAFWKQEKRAEVKK
jgi:hypothetical protein